MVPHGVISDFRGDYAFLSNFYHNPFTWRNKVFPTGEHAFVWAKAFCSERDLDDWYYRVMDEKTPGAAKRIGRHLGIDVAEWDANKVQWMRELVHARFATSDESMVGLLLNTGAKMLVEGNTWGDTFWGRCEGKGFNTLGVLLMEERGYWLRSDFNA